MYLARVSGTVVSTQKNDRLTGHRLLLVRRLGLNGTEADRAEDVALDPGLDAGLGDVVLVAKEGAVVAGLLDTEAGVRPTPANVVIVAIVDDWTVSEPASP